MTSKQVLDLDMIDNEYKSHQGKVFSLIYRGHVIASPDKINQRLKIIFCRKRFQWRVIRVILPFFEHRAFKSRHFQNVRPVLTLR